MPTSLHLDHYAEEDDDGFLDALLQHLGGLVRLVVSGRFSRLEELVAAAPNLVSLVLQDCLVSGQVESLARALQSHHSLVSATFSDSNCVHRYFSGRERFDLDSLFCSLSSTCHQLGSLSVRLYASLSDEALAQFLFNTSQTLSRLVLQGVDLSRNKSMGETAKALPHCHVQILDLILVDFGRSSCFAQFARNLPKTLNHLTLVSLSLVRKDYVYLAETLARPTSNLATIRLATTRQDFYFQRAIDSFIYKMIGVDGFRAFVVLLEQNTKLQHVAFPRASGYDTLLWPKDLYQMLQFQLKLNRIGRGWLVEHPFQAMRLLQSVSNFDCRHLFLRFILPFMIESSAASSLSLSSATAPESAHDDKDNHQVSVLS